MVPLENDDRQRLKQFRENEERRPWGQEPSFPDVPDDWVDPQLAKALDLLQGQLILQRIRGGSAPRPQ